MAFLIFAAFLYFIPTIVGASRGHNNAFAIGVLNLLLGWTLVFWVGALVWACTSNTRQAAGLKPRRVEDFSPFKRFYDDPAAPPSNGRSEPRLLPTSSIPEQAPGELDTDYIARLKRLRESGM